MLDFRLKVFCNVAKNLSFTKAAEELFISQPAVSKHIRELESHYSVRLFEREGNKIALTQEGDILFRAAQKIFAVYREMEFELDSLKDDLSGTLRIGASTTMTLYIIPPVLSEFKRAYPHISLTLINGNSEKIETALLNREIDVGIVEGRRRSKDIKYINYIRDRLVAVAHTGSNTAKLDSISLKDLRDIPLVLREKGSGTREVFEYALKEKNFDLNSLHIVLELGSTQGIKTYLEHTDALGIMSYRAVKKELQQNILKTIPIKKLNLKRYFRFCYLQGQPTRLAQQFMRFACRHNHML